MSKTNPKDRKCSLLCCSGLMSSSIEEILPSHNLQHKHKAKNNLDSNKRLNKRMTRSLNMLCTAEREF
ncbi:unnamed protein product [Arctia plantaginis]|uniref:Uncharacterized protein n=1 Tax=Arctia plantaginis TaxID=874455 RepID=A0A8S1B3B3_ARCPL|nr:unnamed protein product [Arctia plantaginis]